MDYNEAKNYIMEKKHSVESELKNRNITPANIEFLLENNDNVSNKLKELRNQGYEMKGMRSQDFDSTVENAYSVSNGRDGNVVLIYMADEKDFSGFIYIGFNSSTRIIRNK